MIANRSLKPLCYVAGCANGYVAILIGSRSLHQFRKSQQCEYIFRKMINWIILLVKDRSSLAILILVCFSLWSIHLANNMFDDVINGPGERRAFLLGILDSITDNMLVEPLGANMAAVILFFSGILISGLIAGFGTSDTFEHQTPNNDPISEAIVKNRKIFGRKKPAPDPWGIYDHVHFSDDPQTDAALRRRMKESSQALVEKLKKKEVEQAKNGLVNAMPEIDMTNPDHVDWVKSQEDPVLWHQAAMAALIYCGNEHGFLNWLFQQEKMDRSTAAWVLLWPDGCLYLQGEKIVGLEHFSSEEIQKLLHKLCQRSETHGFSNDEIGLAEEWEQERLKALALKSKTVTETDSTFPSTILDKPFPTEKAKSKYYLEEGIIYT